MDGKPDKPHRIRVRTCDGKPRDARELNRLRSNQLGMPHLDIFQTDTPTELIICASIEDHIKAVRNKLAGAGLEEITNGNTTITTEDRTKTVSRPSQQGGQTQHGGRTPGGSGHRPQQGQQPALASQTKPLPGKPYGFVALPSSFDTKPPVWHDGTGSKERFSGEIRCELENLTPLLVGWERGQVGDADSDWPVLATLDAVDGKLTAGKSVLCPLRAPWGKRPVIIPGDSLKGLLRHELGALLGAPMERVAERSYSYRPNAMYPSESKNRFLVPRLASVLEVETKPLDADHQARVPKRLGLFPITLEYNKKANKFDYRFDQQGGAHYRGGQGAGERLNSKHRVHTSLKVLRDEEQTESCDVPHAAQDGYLATLRHLVDLGHGHFSERHPDVPKDITGDEARRRILKAAAEEVFQPGDFIWVEWDTRKKCIVSLGWHYYYRWAYTDTVRRQGGRLERHGLFPLDREREKDNEGAPAELSAVRRLFGYTGDNEGSAGIGDGDYTQLMSRVSVNAALEVVGDNEADDQRFLPPTFLKELGMPRPSAVEFYLKQPYHPRSRPSDRATLVTYGDAAGYDTPGELAGRKFYLDRKDAYGNDGKGLAPGPAADSSPENRKNERSTLALEASKPGRKFRFTVRFRDLDAHEVAAILVALCPDQFKGVLGGHHADGYCSKLGYARPLGWGSVRIAARQLLLLDEAGDAPVLNEADPAAWVKQHHQKTATQDAWLAIHRRRHPDAEDYPRRNGEIFTFHTSLRAEHSRKRRYRQEGC